MKNILVRSFVKTGNRVRTIKSRYGNPEFPANLHFPYRNLVFKGGGIRGIAYAGALDILEQYGILPQIERVAGTSAGAITATLVSFRINNREIYDRMRSLDFTKVPQTHKSKTRAHELLGSIGLVNGELACTSRLITEYGWYSSQYIYEFLQDTIADFCNGDGKATFEDFKARGFHDLSIVASNLSKRRPEIFSLETTPKVAVADAVRLSMSIPFFFNALQYDGEKFGQGDYYVDGGLYNNFPIQIFDHPKYADNNPWYIKGINWQSLGCYLYPELTEEKLSKDPQSLRDYLELTISNFFDAFQAMSYENSSLDKRRTIKINDGGISPVEFNIPTDSPKFHQLIEAGRQAAEKFLQEDIPRDIFA